MEEKERAGAAEPMCIFVSVPRAYKNMVSLLPLALPPLRPQQHNKICAGGRARPRIMDCARFCAAQPLRPLYSVRIYHTLLHIIKSPLPYHLELHPICLLAVWPVSVSYRHLPVGIFCSGFLYCKIWQELHFVKFCGNSCL